MTMAPHNITLSYAYFPWCTVRDGGGTVWCCEIRSDGLVQKRRNSSALAMELLFFALIHRYVFLKLGLQFYMLHRAYFNILHALWFIRMRNVNFERAPLFRGTVWKANTNCSSKKHRLKKIDLMQFTESQHCSCYHRFLNLFCVDLFVF